MINISSCYVPSGVAMRLGMVCIAAVVLLNSGCATIPPPNEQIAVSKESVSRAASAGGNEYAPVELQSATKKMSAAEQAMADKDYVKARRLAEQAQVDAKLAETRTALAKAELAVENAEESNRVLRQEIERAAP